MRFNWYTGSMEILIMQPFTTTPKPSLIRYILTFAIAAALSSSLAVAQVEVDPNTGKPKPQPVTPAAQPTDVISAPAPQAQPQQTQTPARPQQTAVRASQQPAAADHEAGDVSLTIYSTADPAGFDPQQFIAQQRQGYNPNYAWQVPGFGVVRDTRSMSLNQGDNIVSFVDVAQFIDPTTVSLRDLTAQGDNAVSVMKQDFEFDLVGGQKLLEKYIDREITVIVRTGDSTERVTGTLLSAISNQIVLQTPNGVRMLNYTNDIQLGELPGGLVTRPTLKWDIWAPTAGDRLVQTAYQTNGITWRSDYNLVLNESETQADLGAWVTLLNLTGTTYKNAALKLIAGDVQRIQPQQPQRYGRDMMARASTAGMRQEGFEEKSFFEYHMYTLPWNITVKDNSTQQVALFPTKQNVNVEKTLVYYGLPDAARYWIFPNPQTDRNLGNQSNSKVDVYIKFENRESNNLGIPLPKGKVRVYKADPADGSLEFIGEDLIDHTAKNQTVLTKIGQSFDVTGERTQTDYKVDTNAKWLTETIRIKLSNAKDQPQKVIVRENLYRWVNWEITNKSHDFEKVDSRTVHFPVTVPAGSDTTVEYTVRYTW